LSQAPPLLYQCITYHFSYVLHLSNIIMRVNGGSNYDSLKVAKCLIIISDTSSCIIIYCHLNFCYFCSIKVAFSWPEKRTSYIPSHIVSQRSLSIYTSVIFYSRPWYQLQLRLHSSSPISCNLIEISTIALCKGNLTILRRVLHFDLAKGNPK
jgi:hypothetical protein